MTRAVAGLIFLSAIATSGCSITPKPLTDPELTTYAHDKRSRVTDGQNHPSHPVTLREAMSRALKYNLDKEVEVMQLLLAERQLRVAHYSKLPGLVASSGYADRNNYSGGSSVRLTGPRAIGDQSLTSSTSSERDVRTADIRLSWHVLDFGLSYIRARQAADKVLVAEEGRRRVVSRILENVRSAYWRAVAATRLMGRLRRLEQRVRRVLADTKMLAAKGDSAPLTALTYERELVDIQREIRRMSGELSSAKAQLAALINIDPGRAYRVAVPRRLPAPSRMRISARDMVAVALKNRSELREMAYQQRINAKEAEAALLEMLPGISFDTAPAWNSNQFVYNHNWVSWGAQASWNLIKVFSYPDRRAEVEAKDALLDARALAVTMAIMTQVHVSRARLFHARRQFDSASNYLDVQLRILEQIRSALAAGKVSEQTAVREEMNTLVAIAKRDMSYAELQSAVATAQASMGVTPGDGGDQETPKQPAVKKAVHTASVASR